MTPAIRASQIPVPARDGRCSRCACAWTMHMGYPNRRDVDCGQRCSCHDVRFSLSLYEESSLDIELASSSGAQE